MLLSEESVSDGNLLRSFCVLPEKYQGNSPELIIQLSVSDSIPKVHRTCIFGAFWVPCFVVLVLLNWGTLLICGLVVSE